MHRTNIEDYPQNIIAKKESSFKKGLKAEGKSEKILRFKRSERLVHWAIAVPFLVCFTTAVILFVFYNPHPLRPYRDLFSWIHRISGICLIVFPMLAVYKSKGDFRIHFYNIRQAWIWTFADIKWLALMGLAAVSKKITLPEQGKFNAAEKINFMTLMGTYPLYIITGLSIWITDGAFISWIIHTMMAIIATPLLFGHIFMATINPGSRKGLSGMISGYVDRMWAKHHYGGWYREQVEQSEQTVVADQPVSTDAPISDQEKELEIESVKSIEENKTDRIYTLVEADTATAETSTAKDYPASTSMPQDNLSQQRRDIKEISDAQTRDVHPTYISHKKLINLVLLHFALGINYEDTGRYTEATKQYEAILEIGSEHNLDVEEVAEARTKLEALRTYARIP